MSDLSGRIPLVLDGGACGCGVESTVLDALRVPPAVLRPGGATVEALSRLPGLEGLQVYRKDFVDASLEQAPTTPGMKYRHYSPDARVVLLDAGEGAWAGGPAVRAAALRSAALSELRDMAATGVASVAWLRTSTDSGGGVEVAGCSDSEQAVVGTVANGGAAGGANARGSSASASASAGLQLHEVFLGGGDDPGRVARTLFGALRDADARGVQVVLVEGVPDADEGLAVMNRLRKAASRVVAVGR
jgi:L-threonylcarbamoyladenylate synthase